MNTSLSISRVLALKDILQENYGIEIIIDNPTSQWVWIHQIELRGKTEQEFIFPLPPLQLLTYNIQMEYGLMHKSNQELELLLNGHVAETKDEEWGYQAKGEFRYSKPTYPIKHLEFIFKIPVMVGAMPEGRSVIHLLFNSPVLYTIDQRDSKDLSQIPEDLTPTKCWISLITNDNIALTKGMDNSFFFFLRRKSRMQTVKSNYNKPQKDHIDIKKTIQLKILFLGANPLNTLRIRLDEEVKQIQTNLKLAKERNNLEFKQAWAVTTDLLMQSILDESPNIVHFSGHGEREGIILQDESGGSKIITAEALANLFKLFKDSMECIILESCYSEPQAQAIKLYIPYVIGMKSGITDRASIAFSTGFYKAIGAGKDIPFAFELGKAAIQLEGFSGEDIPVLI